MGDMIIKADGIFSPSIDFTGKRYLLLKDGIIEDISGSMPVFQGMRLLDFTGFIVSPFFCDYHLHFSHSALASFDKIAEALLRNGIHEVFEGGDGQLSGMEMKKLMKCRLDVKTAGYALHKKGTYGRHIGKGVEDFHEARVLIDQLAARGVDYVKVVHSGIFQPETGKITSGGFEQAELAEIVNYIKAQGLECICHANGEENIREAVIAGASAIVHGLGISDETLEVMAADNISFIPTVNAFASLSRVFSDGGARASVQKALEGHLSAIRKAAEWGIKVLPGSDAGPRFIPYGTAYHRELDLFRKAGLSDAYILSVAVAGQFRKGMQADFLVLKGIQIEKMFVGGNELDGARHGA
jgi:imidazolonepropionase-like amidohydrolase